MAGCQKKAFMTHESWPPIMNNIIKQTLKRIMQCVSAMCKKPILVMKINTVWQQVLITVKNKTCEYISPCNIADLIANISKDVATQIEKNYRRRQPHCHLTPPPRRTPANIRIHLTFPDTRVIGLHFRR